jgi:hypothetical protein
VLLMGQLTDNFPAGATVSFGGEVGGSTTTDANGNFRYQTNAAGLGQVTAVAMDTLMQSSNTANAQIVAANPTITLAISYGANHQVPLAGKVPDQTPYNRVVSFSGVVSGSATTDVGGNFTATLTASKLGQVTATVIDAWGLSASASATVSNSAPQVSITSTSQQGGYWVITGKVTDVHPNGLVVTMTSTDIPSVNGMTATVGQDGTFRFMFAGDCTGKVSFQTTDWWGVNSVLITDLLI